MKPLRGKWKGRFNMTQSYVEMALLCLSYLSYIDEGKPTREIRSEFPLAQYSASYLMVHTQPTEIVRDVIEAV